MTNSTDLGTIELPALSTQLGRVVLGTMTFGDQVDQATADRIVGRCIDFGVNVFDTASTYTDGRSEQILGRALRPVGDEVIVCTKVGGGDSPLGALSRPRIAAAVRESVRRLGLERVDVLYLHRPDRGTAPEETVDALGELVASGLIRSWGVSNHSSWRTLELVTLADRLDVPRPVLAQPVYNVLSRRIEADFAELTAQLGLPNVVYNLLAGGLLTGKYRAVDRAPSTGRFAKASYRSRYWTPEHMAAVEVLDRVAVEHGLTMMELALRWPLGRPATGAVLVGCSSLEQLEQNLAAVARGPLDAHAEAACDAAWRLVGGVAENYSR